MRFLHHLAIDEQTLPKAAFEELCQLKPQARRPTGIRVDLISDSQDGDDFVEHAVDVMRRYGIPRRYHSSQTTYGHTITRVYDSSDLSSAEFLLLLRQSKIQGLSRPERDERGRLLVNATNVKRSVKIGRVFPNWIVVSDRTRKLLEAGRFVGLRFDEVALEGRSFDAGPEPLWEMRSCKVLPKMSNTQHFIHPGVTEVEKFCGDYSKTVMLDDNPFIKGEVHYRRGDIAPMLPLDIASTFEKYIEPHSSLVISQRFYHYLINNGIPAEAEPVRIDPA